ncbi:hypothetical protein [Paraburkholderia sp. C35]|uniref:hypothetical protein n=1 Tax=Paraburkholderia sp. C35 TaxID=2126993 RepID=UPI000D691C4F|nr:hypothetical protein [Paraburkholderia sp. C35]
MSNFVPNLNMDSQPNSDYVPVYGALIDRAGKFSELFEDAATMRPGTPVFATAVDPDSFKAAAIGDYDYRFRIATVENLGCHLLVFCIQVGGAQFIWLADPADPEFWKMIDQAKAEQGLGFAFLSADGAWFQKMSVPRDKAPYERLRGKKASGIMPFAYVAMMLMHDDELEKHFEGMLPGVEVSYRRICVLLTSEVTKAVESIPGAVIERAAPRETES